MTSAAWGNHLDIQKCQQDIREFQRQQVKPSRFSELTRLFKAAAKKVRADWETFSPEDRSALQKLAYDIIQPRQGIANIVVKLCAIAYMFRIQASGQQQDFQKCLDALDELVDTILDAIERDSSLHQQVLSDTLEEVTLNPDFGEPLDGEKRSEWLQNLSNQAFTEI